MALQTWVARFVVENGRVAEEGGRLRTFQRRRLDDPDVDLHLLAEPTGPSSEEHVGQTLNEIGALFLQDHHSLTGGLLRALRSTHQRLRNWNQRSIARDQVSSGVAALILSGTTAYLAQAGPVLALHLRGDRVQRLGPEADSPPLGAGELAPTLRRLDLEAGDLLLVASPSLSELIDDATLDGMLRRGTEAALPELYLLSRDQPHFALIALTCFEAEAPTSAIDAEAGVDPPPSAAASDTPVTPPVDATAAGRRGPLPLDISRGIVRLRSDQSIERGEYARTTGPKRRFQLNLGRPRWLVLLGGLGLAVVIAVFIVPGLIDEGRQAQLEAHLEAARASFGGALADDDPNGRRLLLEDSRREASEALRIAPDDAAAATLKRQATALLKDLDAIRELGPLTTVVRLDQEVTGGVSVEALVVSTDFAYLLDTRGGRVVAVSLTTADPPSVIFEAGQSYGGTPAKDPIHVVWEGSASAGRLLILDIERKLFEVRPGLLPAPLPLRGTSLWDSVGGLATFDGNLYVLDPTGGRVHRYLPAAVGFDSEPETVVAADSDLEDALAIIVDGDIYVFGRDGAVLRFRNGEDLGFDLAGIDRPAQTPTSVALLAAHDELLIADSGNKRVVVASKDGVFLRQLVSNDFTDLRAIGVDPAGGQLYTVVGDTLLTAPLVR